jgi:hypothetical protein
MEVQDRGIEIAFEPRPVIGRVPQILALGHHAVATLLQVGPQSHAFGVQLRSDAGEVHRAARLVARLSPKRLEIVHEMLGHLLERRPEEWRGFLVLPRAELLESRRAGRFELEERVVVELAELPRQLFVRPRRLLEDRNEPAGRVAGGRLQVPEELVQLAPAHVGIEVGAGDDGQEHRRVAQRFPDLDAPRVAAANLGAVAPDRDLADEVGEPGLQSLAERIDPPVLLLVRGVPVADEDVVLELRHDAHGDAR